MSFWQRALFVCSSLVLFVAALYWAKAVLIPVALAVLLTFILSPLVSMLQRRGFGRVPSAVLVAGVAFCLFAGLGLGVLLQLKRLATDLPQYKDDIAGKIIRIQEAGKGSWLDQVYSTFQDITRQVKEAAPDAAAETGPVAVKVQSTDYWSLLQSVIPPTLEGLVNTALVLILVVFMLIHREDLRNRLIRLWGHGSLTRMTQALDDASQRISRFLLMQLVVNSTFG